MAELQHVRAQLSSGANDVRDWLQSPRLLELEANKHWSSSSHEQFAQSFCQWQSTT